MVNDNNLIQSIQHIRHILGSVAKDLPVHQAMFQESFGANGKT